MGQLNLFGLAPLVVFLPLVGMLINLWFGGRLGEKAIGLVASLAAGAAFGVAVLLGVALTGNPEGASILLANWISVGYFVASWTFRVDTLSVTMMLLVSGVGTLIHIYSIGYMHEDVQHNGDPARFRRFFVFLNLFIAMMMVLVSADNYLMLFVGWEGVGLCSYLLIGFWYEKGENGIGNALAAKKAFIVNRIGDFGLLIAIFILFWTLGTLDFTTIKTTLPQVWYDLPPWAIPAVALFMLLAVAGKSAQLPLYVWLPDAMAGPTPVSALIHAATMVTAGVYLIARSYVIYALSPMAMAIVAAVGTLTALFAATIALAQFDIKKVLAYSTISQLGFMVAALGSGAYIAAIFHLVTHAFFKGLLFLSAGSVIQGIERGESSATHHKGHALDPQDMRNMGGLAGRMKLTFVVYAIGALALAGLPPLAGFWSKDEILTQAYARFVNFQAQGDTNAFAFWLAIYLLLLIAAFFTAFYMGRQVLLVFFGAPRSEAAAHAQESPAVMTIPLMALAILAAAGGLLNVPGHAFSHWLSETIPLKSDIEPIFNVVVISTLIVLIALSLAWYFYSRRYAEQQRLPAAQRPDDPLRPLLGLVFRGMEQKWKVDEFYGWLIVRPYQALARFLANVFDLRLIDGAANGLAQVTQRSAAGLRGAQNGYVRAYALTMVVGVVIILGYLIFR